MSKRILIVALALLTMGVQAFAQAVSGKVTDAQGEAVIGITCALSKGVKVDAASVLGANTNTNYNVIFQGNVNNSNTDNSFGFARK